MPPQVVCAHNDVSRDVSPIRTNQLDEVLLTLFARSRPRETSTNTVCAFAFMTDGPRGNVVCLKRFHQSLPLLTDWPARARFTRQSILHIQYRVDQVRS